MCGRFEQSGTRRYYASALGVDTTGRDWGWGDRIPSYNVAPGIYPWMLTLHEGELEFSGIRWGYRTPEEAAAKKKPWICARVEKALTGRYFRHMFREGRVIIPSGGWFEWTVEAGQKQPWFISRRDGKPVFMAGISNRRPNTDQKVEVGFVIVTQDSEGGMVDVHARRPVVLEPADAWRWMDPETSVEEATHIAHGRSVPSDGFQWWKVSRDVNTPDPGKNRKELLAPLDCSLDRAKKG